jgi:hypothetical protein
MITTTLRSTKPLLILGRILQEETNLRISWSWTWKLGVGIKREGERNTCIGIDHCFYFVLFGLDVFKRPADRLDVGLDIPLALGLELGSDALADLFCATVVSRGSTVNGGSTSGTAGEIDVRPFFGGGVTTNWDSRQAVSSSPTTGNCLYLSRSEYCETFGRN